MPHTIRRADYFYLSVPSEPDEATQILSALAKRGINLLAFAAVPMGPHRTQLTVFPEDDAGLIDETAQAGMALDGPHPALLVQGDDELGALAGIHQRLSAAGVDVFASNGVTDGRGSFGYLLYIRPDLIDRALEALEMSPS